MWVVRAHMLRVTGAILLCSSAGACGEDAVALAWTATVPSAALLNEIEGLVGVVREGGCAGPPMFETPWRPGERGNAPPRLEGGTYGFEVMGLNRDCGLVASGCEEVSLQAGSSEDVVTTLSAAMGGTLCPSDRCDNGVCQQRMDGGLPDAGMDAGQPVDAGADAGVDAGSPRCAPNNVACETFDDNPVGWELRELGGGSASIVAAPTYAGGGALQVAVPSGGTAVHVLALDPPFMEQTFYARFHAYLEASPRFDAFAVVLEFVDTATGNKTSLEFESDDRVQVSAAGGEFESSSIDAVPREEWVCIQFEGRLEPGGGNGFVRVLVNEEARASTRVGADTQNANGFNELRFGVASSAGNQDMQIVFDELVVDDERVDCLPPSL